MLMSQDGGFVAEIDAHISKASKFFGSWKKRVFTNRQFSISTKMKVFRALVRPVLLYGCETWSVTQPNLQRLIHSTCGAFNRFLVSQDGIKSRIQMI